MKERIGYYKRFEHATWCHSHKDECTFCEQLPTHPSKVPNTNCYSVELLDGILYVSKWEEERKTFTPTFSSSYFSIIFK
jgi:hypothetical protein